jgi:hypothetical protein
VKTLCEARKVRREFRGVGREKTEWYVWIG